MPGGIYSALSGLRSRMERLDRISEDIGNSSTDGYKADRATMISVARESFGDKLASAVDVMLAPSQIDFAAGTVGPTGRDLDLAIEGPGFFSIQTRGGIRYTRNGHFTRSLEGTVTTMGGEPVLGEDGPLVLPPGKIDFARDGTISVGKTVVGRPAVTVFANMEKLVSENGVRFRAPDDLTPEFAQDVRIRSGMLESSNVVPIEKMAQLVATSRSFDALQRGISVLMNDLDGKAISELGRR